MSDNDKLLSPISAAKDQKLMSSKLVRILR